DCLLENLFGTIERLGDWSNLAKHHGRLIAATFEILSNALTLRSAWPRNWVPGRCAACAHCKQSRDFVGVVFDAASVCPTNEVPAAHVVDVTVLVVTGAVACHFVWMLPEIV